MNIFVAIKPCNIETTLAAALQDDNAEELLKATAPLVRAFEELDAWACNEGSGRTLCRWGEFFCMEVPADKIDKFAQFSKKWEYVSKLKMAIGLGGTPMEAFYAMEVSEVKNGESIVLYSEDLEQEMSESTTVLSKEEDPFGFTFPNLRLDEPEPQEQKPVEQPAPQESKDDALKQKVVQALMNVKKVAPLLGQLKNDSPETYAAIKQLIDVFLKMAQKNPEPAPASPSQPESAPKE